MINKWEPIAKQWHKFSLEAKKKWAELSDTELARVNGNRNNLATAIQKRYFVTKKEAHHQIDLWIDRLKLN